MQEFGDLGLDLGHRSIRGLPYYDMSGLPGERQLGVFDRLYRRGVDGGKVMVLEIGPADTLTPAETAAHLDRGLVLAVDIASWAEMADEGSSFGTRKVNVGSLGRQMRDRDGVAAFFKIDAHALAADYQFDRVQLVFPTPAAEEIEPLVVQAVNLVKPGGELVVFYEDWGEAVSGKDLVTGLKRRGVAANLELMTPARIKNEYGLTDSEFLSQERVKVIRVTRG
ncbi:MAG: hypothetical protein A2784_04320 [Candidatus Chisholmbacteria bacterium RIFCSPHIGHO2_01_FULL_48_12]|uniref:Methyltransferase type 11 domain-containing protein n=1 Tax=Candidatus Chisholmbacteria bacterium RIFCSPHIGHO2_01_FULL_48_12 TaxID=1797589 RepID=A0A1G1VKC6_9BACT|nr:MAG: hypothetical protein A2784_04320 [Candidatus Chisholmbacteria bacterium RIFCSPHIGHO2_01_FULL_48_12]